MAGREGRRERGRGSGDKRACAAPPPWGRRRALATRQGGEAKARGKRDARETLTRASACASGSGTWGTPDRAGLCLCLTTGQARPGLRERDEHTHRALPTPVRKPPPLQRVLLPATAEPGPTTTPPSRHRTPPSGQPGTPPLRHPRAVPFPHPRLDSRLSLLPFPIPRPPSHLSVKRPTYGHTAGQRSPGSSAVSV